MVFLPVSHLKMGSESFARRSRLSAIAAWGIDLFGLIGAAIRVSRAAEARREPDESDLRRLGIRGPLPKIW
jgi:hypothetical protein